MDKKEQLGDITLYNCDCMDFLRQCHDNEFELAIVDPPYGIGENGDKNKTRGKIAVAKDYKPFAGKDLLPPPIEYYEELMRVSRNQIIWGANHFISRMPHDSSCWVVWDKENGDNDFADCELAWTSFKSSVRIFRFRWAGMLQGDMKNKEERIHPTQKPIALYKWLLHKYAKEGDNILDTHLGSGSIAIACHDYGFKLTGIELDSHYFDKAVERIRRHQRQLTFDFQ